MYQIDQNKCMSKKIIVLSCLKLFSSKKAKQIICDFYISRINSVCKVLGFIWSENITNGGNWKYVCIKLILPCQQLIKDQ